MGTPPRIAQPVVLPRCQGPTCSRPITPKSPHPDFCRELCWRAWWLRHTTHGTL